MNITSSYFNNANDTTPKDINLLEWLSWTINPPKEFERLVNEYRSTLLRKDKIKIPLITPSAAFTSHRDLEHIKHTNHVICFDVDRFAKSKTAPHNPCINFDLLKEFAAQHPSCLYAGFSSSGSDSGLYIIMLIDDNDKLIEYFEYFQKSFARNGINIDQSCKDYSRCRFFSVDREAYFNPNARPFKLKQHRVSAPVVSVSNIGVGILDNADKVWKIILECERLGIDITSNYNDWIKIGGALYNEFGEDGRVMFHRISAVYGSYNYKETDAKFDNCRRLSKTNISSFFYIASGYGVKY